MLIDGNGFQIEVYDSDTLLRTYLVICDTLDEAERLALAEIKKDYHQVRDPKATCRKRVMDGVIIAEGKIKRR